MTAWQHRFRFAAAAVILCCATPALPQAARKPAAAPVAEPAEPPTLVPKTTFTLECSGTYDEQANFTWGQRFGKHHETRPQTMKVDPVSGIVEFANSYISESQPWAAKAYKLKIERITSMGKIVLCPRIDGNPCNKASTKSSSDGGNVYQTVGSVIIDMKNMTWTDWGSLMVIKGASMYVSTTSTEGRCNRA